MKEVAFEPGFQVNTSGCDCVDENSSVSLPVCYVEHVPLES